MRYRVPAFAVLGAVGLLAAGAATLGAATAGSTPSDGATFAAGVLAAAPLPPGGRPTSVDDAAAGTWLDRPPSVPGVGDTSDAHALYLYDEPPTALIGWVRAHLPAGATVSGTGDYTGLAPTLTVAVQVSGAHEYAATLEYWAAPSATAPGGSELRVDALVVWVPSRASDETLPAGSVVEVTGFQTASPTEPSSGPRTVTLAQAAGQGVADLINSLPRAPTPSVCMENSLLFEIDFLAQPGARPSFVAKGYACGATVLVSRGMTALPPLADRNCALLDAVQRVVPPAAVATRHAAEGCVAPDRSADA